MKTQSFLFGITYRMLYTIGNSEIGIDEYRR